MNIYATVFRTQGLLDMRAITTFGINAKPNSENPIGFFGTGLKYAIAVLLREECRVRIWIGKERYTFEATKSKFRDKTFGFIEMEHVNKRWPLGKKKEVPFTTELGKTWKLWQAFRELYSNTLDEQGTIFDCEATDIHQDIVTPEEGITQIVITDPSNKFWEEYNRRGTTFLSPERLQHIPGTNVDVIREPSEHIYYRGMRVMDLEKPSINTYNVRNRIDLTEDRTAKYAFEVEGAIREHITSTHDEGLIRSVVEAPEGSYEHRFDFVSNWHPATPSQAFIQVVRSPSIRLHNPTILPFIKKYDLKPAESIERHWYYQLLEAMQAQNYYRASELFKQYFDEIKEFLENAPKPAELS